MTDYTLDIESTPTGIPIQVTALSQAKWILTPTTLTYTSGTTITVKAPLSAYLDSKNYGFQDWSVTGGSKSTDILQTISLTASHIYTAEFTETGYYPVRDPARRSTKYEKKNDEEVAQIRTIAMKPMMVEQTKTTASEQTALELQVTKIIHPLGLSGIFIHHYRNFSQELYSLKKRFTSESLNTEAQITAEKWQTRGLDPTILTAIAEVLGISITLSPP